MKHLFLIEATEDVMGAVLPLNPFEQPKSVTRNGITVIGNRSDVLKLLNIDVRDLRDIIIKKEDEEI
jgi:hypothetical protein